jgi:hypothetical protein
VHNDGIITHDDHLKSYVNKLDCLSTAFYFGDDHVVLSVEYCEKTISIIETLLHLLIRYREIDLVLSG